MTITEPKTVNRNSDFVNTPALRKYRDDNGYTNQEICDRIGRGVEPNTVSYWCVKGTVPRWVIQELGLKTRGGFRPRKEKQVAAPFVSKGEIYLAYVDKNKEDAFKAFCDAMKINIKPVI